MVEKESEWILPENLRKQEERERNQVENKIFAGLGDFGSYYAYLKGINYNLIKEHAIADDYNALEYAKHLNTILYKNKFNIEGNILKLTGLKKGLKPL